MALWVESLPAMQEVWVRSLGQEDPLEEGMATHSSIFAWRIPWTEEPGWPQPMGLQSWTRLKRLSTHACTSPGVQVGGSQGFLEAGLLALILSPSIKIHCPPLSLCSQRPEPLSSWLACSPPRTWGFGETKARCLSFGLLTQTSPESGARKGLASFLEQRAGKRGDKNTN